MITIGRPTQLEKINLIPVLNVSFLEEAEGFFRGLNPHWAAEYGFRYQGEALERFMERNVCADKEELRSFVLAVLLTADEGYEFVGNQRDSFSEAVKETEYYKNDGLLQLFTDIWDCKIGKKSEISDSFAILLSSKEERLVSLHILDVFGVLAEKRSLVLQLLSSLEVDSINDKEVHERVDDVKILASLHEVLRVKKTECKTFLDVYEFMLHGWRLSKKELKTDILRRTYNSDLESYKRSLKCDEKDVISLHHLLLQWDKSWGNIPEVAKERVFEEYLKVQLTSEEEVSEAFKTQVKGLVRSAENYTVRSVGEWIALIVNEKNLEFVRIASDNFSKIKNSMSVLSMLDHPLFTKENAEWFVKWIISESDKWNRIFKMNESDYITRFESNPVLNTWTLVEKKRKEWKLTYHVKQDYLEFLFRLGLYSKDDFSELKKVNLASAYKSFVKTAKMKNKNEFLRYISMMPVEDREFLGETHKYYTHKHGHHKEAHYFENNVFKEVEDKELYVKLILETVLYHHPSQYGNELHRIISAEALEFLGMSNEEITGLIKFCYENNLFADPTIASKIKERFMSDEEKMERDKNQFLVQVENCKDMYDVRGMLKKSAPYILFEEVRQAIMSAVERAEYKFSSDLPEFYEWLANQNKNKTFPEDMISRMFEKLNELIVEKEKVDRDKLKYQLYAYKVLENHKKETEKRENEKCPA